MSHHAIRRLAVGALSLLAAVASPAVLPGDLPRMLAVRAEPVALSAADALLRACGDLTYRGGVALTADDPRFGGFSGLAVGADGQRLTAISDEGRWLTARLRYTEDGRLAGLDEARLGALLGLDGRPLADKTEQDAESLAVLGDGSLLVGFEHRHRLWRYRQLDPAVAEPYPAPPGLENTPPNGGIESLALLPDGRVLALTEYHVERPGLVGWVEARGKWQMLWYPLVGAYRPADACSLPGGDLLVLERAYNRQRGIVGVRLVRVAAAGVRPRARLQGFPVAELTPPFVLDNFEGLACRKGTDGETVLYLLSDDNFNPAQRTLLLMFTLR